MYDVKVRIKDKKTGYSRHVRFTTEEKLDSLQESIEKMGWTRESNIPPLPSQSVFNSFLEKEVAG